MMDEEVDEELERESAAAGIEPTISEMEVEGANQCPTLSQTKLCARYGTQWCFGRKKEFQQLSAILWASNIFVKNLHTGPSFLDEALASTETEVGELTSAA